MNIELPKTWKEKLSEMPEEGSPILVGDKRDACYAAIREISANSDKVFTIRKVIDENYVFRLKDKAPCQTNQNL